MTTGTSNSVDPPVPTAAAACKVFDPSCGVVCVCDGGWAGVGCEYPAPELALRATLKEAMVQSTVDLVIDLSDRTSLDDTEGSIALVAAVMRRQGELSPKGRATLAPAVESIAAAARACSDAGSPVPHTAVAEAFRAADRVLLGPIRTRGTVSGHGNGTDSDIAVTANSTVVADVTANAPVVRALVTLAQLQSEGRVVSEPSFPLRTAHVSLTERVVGVAPGFGTPDDVSDFVITSRLADKHDDTDAAFVDVGSLFKNLPASDRNSKPNTLHTFLLQVGVLWLVLIHKNPPLLH
jgi:hypothetical protein